MADTPWRDENEMRGIRRGMRRTVPPRDIAARLAYLAKEQQREQDAEKTKRRDSTVVARVNTNPGSRFNRYLPGAGSGLMAFWKCPNWNSKKDDIDACLDANKHGAHKAPKVPA